MHRICPVLLLCFTFCVSYGQQIVNDVIGSSGEQISNSSIIIDQTSGEFVSSTINNTEITLTQGFQQTSQLFYISPVALLQGATIGTSDGLMHDDLRIANYIPTISPNNIYVRESNNAFTVSGDDAIVDWVTIKLRNSNNKIVSEKFALIQRDGDVVSADGTSPIQLTPQNKDYKVEINHRNHLGVMTESLINLDTTPLLDFTDSSTLILGSYARAQLASGSMALWAGDTNNTNQIRFSGANNSVNPIRDHVLNDSGNFFNLTTYQSTGYLDIDVDMNGIGRFSGSGADSNIIRSIILSYPGNFFNLTTYKINGTVPE